MLYSQLKGKKVYSLKNAEFLGAVSGGYINKEKRRLTHLLLDGEKGNIVSFKDIFAFGEIITVRGQDDELIEVSDYHLYDCNTVIYDVEGNFVDNVSDMEIKERRKLLFIGEAEYTLKAIACASKDMLILNPKKRALVRRPRKPKTIENAIVVEHVTHGAAKLVEEISFPIRKNVTYKEPVKTDNVKGFNDYSFLLGRKIVRDISDITKTFYLRAGTIITDGVIEAARRAGKLVDLTINSQKS